MIIITRSNQGLISAFEHWSLVDNTCHIHFFVDRIMHFLYVSEAVNKFLINVLDLFKKHCFYFQEGLSLNLLSADKEYDYNL